MGNPDAVAKFVKSGSRVPAALELCEGVARVYAAITLVSLRIYEVEGKCGFVELY